MILKVLFKNRKKLNEMKIYIRYGYLYLEYKIFYWEFVGECTEKILLIAVVEFYDTKINVKGLLSLLIVGLYFVLNSRLQP